MRLRTVMKWMALVLMAPVLMALVWCGGGVLGALWAQSAGDGGVAAVLRRLQGQSQAYQRAIPNFACREVINTTMKLHGKDKLHANFEDEIQVSRAASGKLQENWKVLSFMGKPPVMGQRMNTIAYVEDGLAYGLPDYFSTARAGCYDYTLQGNRVELASRPQPKDGCKEVASTRGFGEMDDQGMLRHGELRHSAADARANHLATFAAIDYAQVRLGKESYQMPTHLYAEIVDSPSETRVFDAYFTACRLYKVTSTIEPAVTRLGPAVSHP